MTGQRFYPIVLSIPGFSAASGVTVPSGIATAAATFTFFTNEYKPPAQERYMDMDVVKNQNGKFKWVYDNGPGFRTWAPFKFLLSNTAGFPGSATQQLADLNTLWQHVGPIGMQGPDGPVYKVIWADNSLEQSFRIFPSTDVPPDHLEYIATVQFEEVN